ncbi:uncharacterized protein LOC119692058 isoform X2 [Plutella xylostella]|nr:uncharacterized protein LOC119692058 isoform X2 [Plutella xylostella]
MGCSTTTDELKMDKDEPAVWLCLRCGCACGAAVPAVRLSLRWGCAWGAAVPGVRLCLGCGWACACGCGGAAGVESIYIAGCRPGVGAVVTAAVRAVNININRTKAGGTVEEMAISGVSTQTEDTRPYHTRLRRESELRFACSMADGRQWRRCPQQDWSYIYSCMITMIIIRSTELGVIYILFS